MPVQIENIELFDVDDVALVINKHPNTVRSYIRKGEINAKMINGGWYVSRAELESIVKGMNFPISVIDFRLGLRSPKSNNKITGRK